MVKLADHPRLCDLETNPRTRNISPLVREVLKYWHWRFFFILMSRTESSPILYISAGRCSWSTTTIHLRKSSWPSLHCDRRKLNVIILSVPTSTSGLICFPGHLPHRYWFATRRPHQDTELDQREAAHAFKKNVQSCIMGRESNIPAAHGKHSTINHRGRKRLITYNSKTMTIDADKLKHCTKN